jgi:hypothetical protein
MQAAVINRIRMPAPDVRRPRSSPRGFRSTFGIVSKFNSGMAAPDTYAICTGFGQGLGDQALG